ncbi:MAG: L-aspartate oxidase [Parvibaculum sp.]|uniref:L-aspartate oxidase n=1 Tax=Parvibaculum sp. TaxID=2024848 RepID=UPI0027320551|nr:L-aspartate oxidase [Parvibaculum sp.]MDP2148826.1 L-aspartate oxidase [Parvibaculum sp.]
MARQDIETKTADVVIVGSGAAGLFAALTLAAGQKMLAADQKASARKPRIMVLSEKALGGVCASAWAQGGIAAVVAPEDTTDSHIADTLKAAAGTADLAAVKTLVEAAPRYIEILAKYGVRFERDDNGAYRLNREACHACRRVLKAAAADGFGAELMRALSEAVRQTPEIEFIAGVSAERLLREDGPSMGAVSGVLTRRLDDQAPVVFLAKAVLLATGGIGGLYAATTNPLHAIGRGVAMAARAGAVLSDLEFVQFHPTALDIGEDPAPLATEALRGEGAYLLNSRGERFMLDYHEAGELAPRDVVSRGIFAQMQKGQKVYLDCRHIDTAHFPALISAAGRAGLNPQRDLIPVMPAVHYHMGGIATDLSGRSSLAGLWAAGECAATGLHGANRLASNSLMEAVVMGARAAEDIAKDIAGKTAAPRADLTGVRLLPAAKEPVVERDILRQIMSELVGVIRNDSGLTAAIGDFAALGAAAETRDARTADMALLCRMIAVSALMRRESRGGHCRSDYPQAVKALQKRSFVTLKETEAVVASLMPAAAPQTQNLTEKVA